jgi:hypothetical protein
LKTTPSNPAVAHKPKPAAPAQQEKKMEAKHTPGPWKYEADDNVIIGGDGLIMTWQTRSIDVGVAERDANAEFIVRACNSHDDLMAALEDMMAWARAVSDEYIDGGDLREDYRQALSDARDALAAGRGAP